LACEVRGLFSEYNRRILNIQFFAQSIDARQQRRVGLPVDHWLRNADSNSTKRGPAPARTTRMLRESFMCIHLIQ